MAIAGIEPVGHLANKVGDLPSGTKLYTDEQVYEILKKAAEYWVDNYDHYNEQFIDIDYDIEVTEFIKLG